MTLSEGLLWLIQGHRGVCFDDFVVNRGRREEMMNCSSDGSYWYFDSGMKEELVGGAMEAFLLLVSSMFEWYCWRGRGSLISLKPFLIFSSFCFRKRKKLKKLILNFFFLF